MSDMTYVNTSGYTRIVINSHSNTSDILYSSPNYKYLLPEIVLQVFLLCRIVLYTAFNSFTLSIVNWRQIGVVNNAYLYKFIFIFVYSPLTSNLPTTMIKIGKATKINKMLV